MSVVKNFHATISGRVQGVGFRYFVQGEANVLAIKGWVRNRWDGTVEVMAQGEKKNLESFLNQLKKGPSGARVVNLEVEWPEEGGVFTDFRVRRTID